MYPKFNHLALRKYPHLLPSALTVVSSEILHPPCSLRSLWISQLFPCSCLVEDPPQICCHPSHSAAPWMPCFCNPNHLFLFHSFFSLHILSFHSFLQRTTFSLSSMLVRSHLSWYSSVSPILAAHPFPLLYFTKLVKAPRCSSKLHDAPLCSPKLPWPTGEEASWWPRMVNLHGL